MGHQHRRYLRRIMMRMEDKSGIVGITCIQQVSTSKAKTGTKDCKCMYGVLYILSGLDCITYSSNSIWESVRRTFAGATPLSGLRVSLQIRFLNRPPIRSTGGAFLGDAHTFSPLHGPSPRSQD